MLHSYQKPLGGKSVGVVFGSFAPLHQGHLDLIMRAKKENDGGCVVVVCGYDGDKGEPLMPHKKRYRYVREFFADDDLVAVYAINDTEINAEKYPEGWVVWMQEFENIWDKAIQKEFNPVFECLENNTERVWYVGDENYYNDLVNMWDETAILVDRISDNPICATMIRQNPIKHWDKITLPFKRVFSTNILITGTASEGKSTMVTDLGKYFNAPHSHEWARDYMLESCVSDWELDCADFLAFLEGQYNHNKQLINSSGNHGIFFADTDSLVTNMYSQYYAKDSSCVLTEEEYNTKIKPVAYEYAKKSKWDKIFCIVPHGVFVDDHERFMAHSGIKERQELFEILKQSLIDVGDWDKVTILDGNYYENFMAVVNYVREVEEHGKN
jgi:NadR type nicotinamide-nucleotide adenylyltransferase